MTNSTTATVETLTAEVRVLMVGSRQVTLSVFGQLDEVEYEQIDPFGRVRPKGADRSDTWVVGRGKADGSLVRARPPRVSDVLDREPFSATAQATAVEAIGAIRSAAEDALEAVVRETVDAFALLVQARFFGRDKAEDVLTKEARNAGLWFAGRIPADFRRRISEIDLERSTGGFDGPFASKALSVIRAYGQAEAEAEITVAGIRRMWSELPLIVLAGLR